ncbi:type IV secretion system DNA-binding domain-containing protein [candidate division WWE3 bacterium]|nr:type IV secretion system DNA-binding domain-containing protein [candidate division WWE3 bacterium]
MIKVPKLNEKGALAAEMFFSTLHGLLQEDTHAGPFSFEIVANSTGISFYAFVDERERKFLESQLYAQYPTAEMTIVEDYASVDFLPNSIVRGTEIRLEKPYYYPIKSFPDFDVDPLAAITGAVESLGEGERVWFQMIVKPLPEGWQAGGYKKIDELRTGKKEVKNIFAVLVGEIGSGIGQGLMEIVTGLLIMTPPKKGAKKETKPKEKKYEMTEEAKLEIEAIKKKLSLLGFEVNMRIVGIGPDEVQAQQNVASMVAALKQYSSGEINAFTRAGFVKDPTNLVEDYRERRQPREDENLFILNTEELASIFHLPNASVATPNIDYILSKRAEPPIDLPTDTSMKFAVTTFRNRQVEFGVKPDDRRRHMYIIGKTGTGKTTLIRNMIIQDIRNGEGLAVIDPHGDLFNYVLDYIPEERIDDVVVFDPADIDYPVALNMFELFDPDQRALVTSGLVEIFRKRFEFSWGPRMEHLLRNVFLTFLEIPNSTLLGVTRILVDRAYRRYIVNLVEDPVLREFWNHEFEQMMSNDRMAAEAVGPIQNRLGPFLSTPTIRNLMGQAVGTVDIPRIMNTRKILLVNLSKGGIGEDNSAILGSFLVSRLWFAALTRTSIPEPERQDFHVYVDEFQNFATSSFASILSESRKYRMNLVMAHQYISQLAPGGDTTVRDAVFGNVGTLMTYVTGQEDAEVLGKLFEPTLEANDIIHLGRFQLYLKLMIDAQQSRPFSAAALPPITDAIGSREAVIARSRQTYGRPRRKVEEAIRRWAEKTFAPGMDDTVVQAQRDAMYGKYKELKQSVVDNAGS